MATLAAGQKACRHVLNMGTTDSSLGQSLLKGIYGVVLCCSHEMLQKYNIENERAESEVQTPPTFTPTTPPYPTPMLGGGTKQATTQNQRQI